MLGKMSPSLSVLCLSDSPGAAGLWEPQGLRLASIHHSPLFLKPRAIAGTLTPSGPDSLPPDFAPCWKALHPARGTLGSCSHKLPGFFSPEA